jgi:hypothetical protein
MQNLADDSWNSAVTENSRSARLVNFYSRWKKRARFAENRNEYKQPESNARLKIKVYLYYIDRNPHDFSFLLARDKTEQD